MAHNVSRLTNSLFSKPLFMTESSCQEVVAYLDKRNATSLEDLTDLASVDLESISKSKKRDICVEGVGMINIFGGLSTYKIPMESLCNTTSYETIIEQATEFASDDSIKVIAMNVRSGGGMAHKAFELSNELKSIAEGSGKKLVCYVDESACSAAYIFACVADKVMINSTAKAGSIGVLIQLMNESKALEKEGIERTFVTSTDGKVPYAKDGSFREEFLADLQEEVSALYEDFINHVVQHRGMESSVIRDTNAKVYSARKAKSLGLVDEIMSTKKFKEYLQELVGNSVNLADASANPMSASTQINTKTKEVKLMTDQVVDVITPEASVVDANADMAAKLAEMQAALEAQTAQLSAYKAKEVEDAKAALSADLDNSPFLAECKESLMSFFMSANNESNKELMHSVINAANAEMSAQAVKAEEALNVEKEASLAKVKAAEQKAEETKLEADAVKEEFATTKFSETSETKEMNVQLSHEEKLARAVEAEKAAKRNL